MIRAIKCENYSECKFLVNTMPKQNCYVFYYLVSFLKHMIQMSSGWKQPIKSKVLGKIFPFPLRRTYIGFFFFCKATVFGNVLLRSSVSAYRNDASEWVQKRKVFFMAQFLEN